MGIKRDVWTEIRPDGEGGYRVTLKRSNPNGIGYDAAHALDTCTALNYSSAALLGEAMLKSELRKPEPEPEAPAALTAAVRTFLEVFDDHQAKGYPMIVTPKNVAAMRAALAPLPEHCIGKGEECTEPDDSCAQCPSVPPPRGRGRASRAAR